MSCNDLGMCFIDVPAGTFLMGEASGVHVREYTKQHRVRLSKPFALQQSTVTVGQWRRFVEDTGYVAEANRPGGESWIFGKREEWKLHWLRPRRRWFLSDQYSWDNPNLYQDDSHPVTCVSWNDALAFVDWLQKRDDRPYRLPTEAEWEYACRAGTTTAYSFGDRVTPLLAKYHCRLVHLAIRFPFVDELLHLNGTVPVDSFYPNQWGFYNMHGNVWEWCQDSVGKTMCNDVKNIESSTYVDDIEDPVNLSGECRILRGGSWAYPKAFGRSAHRRAELPEYNASGIGFRLALDL